MSGGTEADLTVTARKTELYVCRVNEYFGNFVFSDWVKVKVLDIDKSGIHCAMFMLISAVSGCTMPVLFLCFCMFTISLPPVVLQLIRLAHVAPLLLWV